MLHKDWNSKGEMLYCFPRSSIKFQGHTVQNITDFDPNLAFSDYRPVAAFKSLRFALFWYSHHLQNFSGFWLGAFSGVDQLWGLTWCLFSSLSQSNFLLKSSFAINWEASEIILCLGSANERRRYAVMPSLIGWSHTQNDPWACISSMSI